MKLQNVGRQFGKTQRKTKLNQMKNIIFLLVILLFSCNSKKETKTENSEKQNVENVIKEPKITGEKYFEYDREALEMKWPMTTSAFGSKYGFSNNISACYSKLSNL